MQPLSAPTSHVEGGIRSPAVGEASRQTALQRPEASVCFPKGTTEGLEYMELRDHAIKNTFGRNTRASEKLI